MSAFQALQDIKTIIQGLMNTIESIPTQKGEEEVLITDIYHLLEQLNDKLEPYRDIK